MHTYKRVRDGDGWLWVVGHYEIAGDEHYSSSGVWNAMKDFDTEYEAAAYTNYLNGGHGSFSDAERFFDI